MEIHERGEETKTPREKRLFIIRQVLNIIFMVGAVAGAILYWVMPEETLGILVVMTAMFFKMAECALRIKR